MLNQDKKNAINVKDYLLKNSVKYQIVGDEAQTSCLNPAHKDEKPSMSVNLNSGAYFCHGCGCKGGDVVALHQLINGIDFQQAINDLNISDKPKQKKTFFKDDLETLKQVACLLGRTPRDLISKGYKLKALYKIDSEYYRIRFEHPDKKKFPKAVRHMSYNGTDWIPKKKKYVNGTPPYLKINQNKPEPIFFVEGEKDVDTLFNLGFSACTTGGTGSLNTKNKEKKCNLENLAKKEVWLWADNDDAGEEFLKAASRCLLNVDSTVYVIRHKLLNMPEKADVTDYIELKENVTPEEILNLPKDLVLDREVFEIPDAVRVDYFELIHKRLGQLKKDVLSGETYFYDKQRKYWRPVDNQIKLIQTLAHDLEDNKIKKFNVSKIERYLEEYKTTLEYTTLFEIPKWDGVDHISELVSHFEVDETGGDFCNYHNIEHQIKDFLCKAYKRIGNPRVRNETLVFIGGQNLGKDYLISHITGGIRCDEHDIANTEVFTFMKNEVDMHTQMEDRIFCIVPEYDKISFEDQSKLKAITTTASARNRAAYDRKKEKRIFHCSFIGSTNSDNIYKDPTGLSRLSPIYLKKINFKYDDSFETSKQILAQAKHLAESNYKMPVDVRTALDAFLVDKTPISVEKEVADDFNDAVVHWWNSELNDIDTTEAKASIKRRFESSGLWWMTNGELEKTAILLKLCKQHKMTIRQVRTRLKITVGAHKSEHSRGYLIPELTELEVLTPEYDYDDDDDEINVSF